jgi:stalled ribosome rescue protein Dom34
MSEYYDAMIFIDRREAKVFHLSADERVKLEFLHTSAQRRHHLADHEDGTKHAVDDEFMHGVVGSLDHSGQTLIAGPGNSKYELQKYMQQHAPDLATRIAGVETLDDPNDGAILELARRFFRTRGHRHGLRPEPSSRHFDTPSKS